jgi:hypothetical protein
MELETMTKAIRPSTRFAAPPEEKSCSKCIRIRSRS